MTNQAVNSHAKAYSRIVIFFLLLTVAAIFVVLHFALAKTTITLNTYSEDKSATILVEMQSEDNTEELGDAIRGKIISTDFEISTSGKVSQTKVEGKKAAGYVTIYNNYSKDQPLVATTRLLTPDNKLFRISEGVTVPAGGQAEVWAQADQEGEEFIIEPTKFIIPGLWEGLQNLIYAESSETMAMQSIPKYIISQADIDKALTELNQRSQEQALSTINELLSDNLKIDNTKLLIDTTITEIPNIGQEIQEFDISQTVSAHALVFSDQDLEQVAKVKFSKELGNDEAVIDFANDNLVYKIVEVDLEKEKAIIEISLKATINSNQGLSGIDKEELIGLNETEIKEYLEARNIQDANIEFWPFWVKKVPNLKDHIIIN